MTCTYTLQAAQAVGKPTLCAPGSGLGKRADTGQEPPNAVRRPLLQAAASASVLLYTQQRCRILLASKQLLAAHPAPPRPTHTRQPPTRPRTSSRAAAAALRSCGPTCQTPAAAAPPR